MEHQSSVTYGNGFRNGYRGRDLSGTGVGLKFDFIIVHESAHEWWGNNVSMVDSADMWIHESFANYAENLFVDYHFSSEEAADYVIGCRDLIQNDRPIIGTYGVNNRGSGDMYYKGGNMLHTMRTIVGDDDRWRNALRGINEQFRHRTVSTDEIESFLSERCGFDFGPLFDQYLRTTDIPLLVQTVEGKQVTLSFEDVVEGFEIPVRLTVGDETKRVSVGSEPVVVEFGAFGRVGRDRPQLLPPLRAALTAVRPASASDFDPLGSGGFARRRSRRASCGLRLREDEDVDRIRHSGVLDASPDDVAVATAPARDPLAGVAAPIRHDQGSAAGGRILVILRLEQVHESSLDQHRTRSGRLGRAVGNREHVVTSGLQGAGDLTDGGFRVGDVLEDILGDHQIE